MFIAKFERNPDCIKLAKLQARKLEPHEGYLRGNDGSWWIPIIDENGETIGRAEIFFRGKAKRGHAFSSPDPMGLARAHYFVQQFNSHP